MSKDNKGDKLKESPKDLKKQLDLNDVEMVFGTPNSPKGDVKLDKLLITNEKRQEKGPAPKHPALDNDVEVIQSTQPLLEPDRNRPQPPLAGPEVDDLDEKPADATPFPGIDDGLLEPTDNKPDINDSSTPEIGVKDSNGNTKHDDGVDTEDGKWPWRDEDQPDYPYGEWHCMMWNNEPYINGFGPRFGLDDRPGSPMIPGSIPDVNTYQQKKNLAQGMMDLALLSANANQLRYVLESSTSHPYYYPSLTFISLSILLQIAVGVGLIMNSQYNVKDEKDICKADKINNMTILGIFLITIVNVFITSFSVATPNSVNSQQIG